MRTTSLIAAIPIRSTRARVVRALVLLPALLLMMVAAPAQAAVGPPPGQDGLRGCGPMTVASAPWQNFIDGAPTEWGTHWIVSWEGPAHPNCTFAKKQLAGLIGRKVFDQAANPSKYQGGICKWRLGSGHETIRPFQRIQCVLPLRVGRKTVHPLIEAIVDPDPLFIHPGTAPS